MISRLLEAFGKENKDSYLLKREDLPESIRQLLAEDIPVYKPETVPKAENTAEEITEKTAEEMPEPGVMPNEPVLDVISVYTPAPRPELEEAALSRPLPLATLIPCIRPAQRKIFTAIHSMLTAKGEVASPEQVSLVADLPLQEGQSYHRFRCTIPLDGTLASLQPITPHLYQGEPLFPRLLANGQEAALPDDLRQQIYHSFLAQNDYSTCPLHNVPRLMLRLAYTKPDWSFAKMEQYINVEGKYLDGERISIKADTIKQHFKRTISKVALNFFEVSFSNNRDIGEYWPEMGFNLAPIPELSA